MAERPVPDVQEASAPPDDDALAAALAQVFGMSWEDGAPDPGPVVETGSGGSRPGPDQWVPEMALAGWSPEAVPESASPEAVAPTWTPESALSEWSPEAAPEPGPTAGEGWAPETALSEWSPETALEPEPPDPGPSEWWDAWSGEADTDASPAEVDVEAAPEAGPRRAAKPDEAAAAL